jgi:hypothetical protein
VCHVLIPGWERRRLAAEEAARAFRTINSRHMPKGTASGSGSGNIITAVIVCTVIMAVI